MDVTHNVCQLPCHDHYQCEVEVEKILPCQHIVKAPCFQVKLLLVTLIVTPMVGSKKSNLQAKHISIEELWT